MEQARQSPEAELLAEVPFFQLLDDEERNILAAQLDIVRFDAGHLIFNYGDPGDSLYRDSHRRGRGLLQGRHRGAHHPRDRPRGRFLR